MGKTYTQEEFDAALEQMRVSTLEEAAKLCEQIDANNRGFPLNAKTYAAAIRSLKEKP